MGGDVRCESSKLLHHHQLTIIQEAATSSGSRSSSGEIRGKKWLRAVFSGIGSLTGAGKRLQGKGPTDYVLQQPYVVVTSKYVLHKDKLGSGFYGVIRRCMDLETGEVFACKTIKKEIIRVRGCYS